MVTRTNRFHGKVGAIRSTSSLITSTVKMEKGGSRVGWVAPPEVNRMTPSGLGLLLQALGPKERATPAAAAAKLVVAMAPCAPDLRSPKTDKGAAGVSVPTGQAVTWKGPLSAVSDPGVTTLVPPHAAVPGQCLCLELRFSMEENESGDLRSPAPFSVPVLLPLCSVPRATRCATAGNSGKQPTV